MRAAEPAQAGETARREAAKGRGPALQAVHGGHAVALSVEALAREASGCERCDLFRDATQTVFGEGPGGASVVLVGEQPGDKEDRAGRPFVGPAGQLLDKALESAGIDRSRCYVTNAVKHFKFQPRGKRRMHARPNAGEIRHCSWWLAGELALIRPQLVVALGATAVSALLGPGVKVTAERGRILRPPDVAPVLVTVHPSFLLRRRGAPETDFARFVEDLRPISGFL